MPSTLQECFRLARQQIPEEDLKVLSKSKRHDLVSMHFGLGLFIRNQWLYPKGSGLREKFIGIGIIHPDDMSAILAEALWLDISGHDIGLPALRELVGWPGQSRFDRQKEDARLSDLMGTANSRS